MGWTFQQKPANVKAYLNDSLTWETETNTNRVLDSAICRFSEYYAAVETTDKVTGETKVWAAAFMLKFTRDYYHSFGYKDMSEDMGPNIDNCPGRILSLLSPTNSLWANQWRSRCREKVENSRKRKGVTPGDTIKFANKLKFTNGIEADTFRAVRHGKRGIRFEIPGMGFRFQISNWRERGYQHVAET